MSRIEIVFGLLILLVSAACTKKDPDTHALFISGRIDGDTVDIASKRDGKIVEITAREGDSVDAGQLLARISSPQEEAQKANVIEAERKLEEASSAAPARVAVSEASLAAARADLVRRQAELQLARMDATRYPPLVRTGAAAAQMADQHETDLNVAVASTDASRKQVLVAEAALQEAKAELEEINTARANVAASRAQLRRLQANVSDLAITAPIAGTILTRSAEPGRVIAAGQTIVTMVDLQKLYLRGFVPEGNVGEIKVGQQAQVYLDSDPKQAVPAEVIRIDPQVMFTPENTYFKDDRVKQVLGVKLGLKGAFGFAKPGMPADGKIYIGGS